MEDTVNANIHPGYKNDLVDMVGELEPEAEVKEKKAPKPRAKKKATSGK